MARGGMVSISQQVHSCHGVHDLPLAIIAARAWMPLTYDSSVFAMTLWRTLWNKEAAPIKLKMLCNGTLYYTVICPANLALTVMIVRAPPGQKGVAAQLVFLLTVVMTSRVTISLRKPLDSPPPLHISCDQQRNYSIHSPTLSKPVAALLEPRETLNLQLQPQCSTVDDSSLLMDTDDVQFLGDRPPNRPCADVESQRCYDHDLSQ